MINTLLGILTPRETPEIPYRRHTPEESKSLGDFARSLPIEERDKFWMGTTGVARMVVRNLERDGVYLVGGVFDWRESPERYGSRAHIYSRNHDRGSVMDPGFHRDILIGIIGLWEYGGFSSHPVKVLENIYPVRTPRTIALKWKLDDLKIPFEIVRDS